MSIMIKLYPVHFSKQLELEVNRDEKALVLTIKQIISGDCNEKKIKYCNDC